MVTTIQLCQSMQKKRARKPKGRKRNKYGVEHMTKEEIDEITKKYDESRPEGLEHRSERETCIRRECKGLEGCMLELASKLEKNRTNECCNVMLNSMHANNLKHHKREYDELADKFNSKIKRNENLAMKYHQIEEKCYKIKDNEKNLMRKYDLLVESNMNLKNQVDMHEKEKEERANEVTSMLASMNHMETLSGIPRETNRNRSRCEWQ